MKADRNITALVLLFLACITLSAQSNKVYWIHGLNDSSSSMSSYKQELTTINQRGRSFLWGPGRSLDYSAFKLDSLIKAEVSSSKTAIVVGHSAGGLVARKANKFYGNKIRAIITLGTPNNGAQIATHVRSGKVSELIDRVSRMIERCLIMSSNAFGTSIGITSTAASSVFSGIIHAKISVESAVIRDSVERLIQAFDKPGVLDMEPGSSFLTVLNNLPITVPIINIYGNEKEKRLIHLLGSFNNEAVYNNARYPNFPELDEQYVEMYNAAVASTAVVEALHYVAATNKSLLSMVNPLYSISAGLNYSAASAWGDMNRFIEYDIHNEWDEMIGSYHYEQIETHHQFLWWHWTDVEYVKVYEDSDGFIPNKSSHIDPSKGVNVSNIKVEGVNHLEMTAHYSIFEQLKNIINQNSHGTIFNPNHD